MREIILTSSVLIVIITLLRYLLRGKITPRLQYALWMLVAVRLLVPGMPFTVPVSVTGAADGLSAAIERSTVPSVPDTPVSTAAPVSGGTAPDIGTAAPETVPVHHSGEDRPAKGLLESVWKVGILVTGSTLLLSNLIFYRNLRRRRRRVTLPPECETGNLPVYLVEDLPSPCLFGLFCPAIYLNGQSLDPAHLTYVLTHERTHFRHGDHIWTLLRGICLTVHWYNPLVWLAASLSRQDCELACDDGVIWLLGERQRLDYGTTLVQMITPSRTTLLRASTSMTAGKRNMKKRISLIVQRPRMLKATAALTALAVCGAVALTFGSTAAMAGEAEVQDILPQDIPHNISAVLPEAPRSLTLLEDPSYIHFSGLFSLSVPEDWAGTLLYEENEDGVYFYDAVSYQESPDESLLFSIYPQALTWAETHVQNAVFLDRFNPNGSPYVYLLDCNQTDGEHVQALRDAVTGSFHLYAGAGAFSRLVHDTYETDLSLAATYLPYLSWESCRDMYGEEEIGVLLNSFTAFVRTGKADWGQYHDFMSNRSDAAIDSGYTDAYLDLVWELYRQNPAQFASVLESEYLTGAESRHMLSWFRSAAAVKQDWPEILEFSDAEVYSLLGINEVKAIG